MDIWICFQSKQMQHHLNAQISSSCLIGLSSYVIQLVGVLGIIYKHLIITSCPVFGRSSSVLVSSRHLHQFSFVLSLCASLRSCRGAGRFHARIVWSRPPAARVATGSKLAYRHLVPQDARLAGTPRRGAPPEPRPHPGAPRAPG